MKAAVPLLVLLVGLAVAPAWAGPPVDDAALASRVRDEFLHAWQGYERYAWGHDELRPVSRTPRDWAAQTLLITPVDALDALLILDCDREAARAHALIADSLSFDEDIVVKNFEITIRELGGLLSGYQLTGDERLLSLADDLGTRLLPVFDSPTGMPYMYVNLKTGKTSGNESNPAEIGTLLLEFGTLSRLTGKPEYFDRAKHAVVALYKRRSKIGLVGEAIDVRTGKWLSRTSHVGGGIDSYYEYLLKSARLFGDADCERMWRESVKAINTYLADDTHDGLWYGEADMETGRRTATEFGALQAFLPAVLVLGGDTGRGRRLEDSCRRMWEVAGIEPEIIDYKTMHITVGSYPLRPEIIESAYYLHWATHDAVYQEMGKEFFDALVSRCRTDAGYTVLKDVVTGEKGDLMPSYFLAETLKYLYLLFQPAPVVVGPSHERIDLDSIVFNTEAHPLRATGSH